VRRLLLVLLILAPLAGVLVVWHERATVAHAAPIVPPAAGALRPASGFDAARAWDHLRALVAIGPRPAGSPQIREARAYITRQLDAMGLTVEEQPFTAETPLGPVAMTNLVVRLPGRRTDRILFTGHYDTKLMRNAVFVGASDGASSAAFLIELARVLKDRPREFTEEIVWFDGEEAFGDWMGLDHTYGSRYYVQAAGRAHALASLRAMILVDMIGARDLTLRRDSASTLWLNDLFWAAARDLGYGRVFVDATTEIEDDHNPFTRAGVPSIDLIDLDYPPWHTPDDDLNHVSAQSLQIVGDVVLTALPRLEDRLAKGAN
jgi:glutaminyl-peptide cyclotransferase